MTLSQLINKVNAEKPNAFSEKHLTLFVTECEAMVQEYLGIKPQERVKYDWATDKDKELIAPPPFDGMYEAYLKAKMDYVNEEHQSYANNQAQFEVAWAEYKAFAVREGLVEAKSLRFRNWY